MENVSRYAKVGALQNQLQMNACRFQREKSHTHVSVSHTFVVYATHLQIQSQFRVESGVMFIHCENLLICVPFILACQSAFHVVTRCTLDALEHEDCNTLQGRFVIIKISLVLLPHLRKRICAYDD